MADRIHVLGSKPFVIVLKGTIPPEWEKVPEEQIVAKLSDGVSVAASLMAIIQSLDINLGDTHIPSAGDAKKPRK